MGFHMTPRTLRWLNIGVFFLQALTGAAICGIYDKDVKLPWYTDFIASQERDDIGGPLFYRPINKRVANIPIGLLSGIFLLLSAVNHGVVALPFFNGIYNRHLAKNINAFRWIEYSISAAIMHVMIAQLSGVTEVHLLYTIFGLTSTTMLHGWLMERANSTNLPNYELSDDLKEAPTEVAAGAVAGAAAGADGAPIADYETSKSSGSGKIDWYPFWFGFIPHLFVWSVIACYFFEGVKTGSPPGFVWAIIFILFFIDLAFAVNQLLQFYRVPGWRGFGMPEFWYIILSISAKQLLAWINYGGTRRFSN